MHKDIIERGIPDVGALEREQLRLAARGALIKKHAGGASDHHKP